MIIALSEGRSRSPDGDRRLGLVVDDREAVRAALQEAGVEISSGADRLPRSRGNQIQIVESRHAVTKAPSILKGVGLESLQKSPTALEELREEGLWIETRP